MGTDIHGVFQAHSAGQWRDIESRYAQQRHYQLFAALAGVRNGTGFAGIRTGEPITPISEPRGLPTDFAMIGESHPIAELAHMDPLRREWHRADEPLEVWMGDHSHSWLTGDEMLAWFAAAPTLVQAGVLTREQYAEWDGKKQPRAYCGAVWGRDVVTIDDNDIARAGKEWTHVRVHWDSPMREELAYFFDEVRRLSSEHGQIRFVFGFDS